MELYLQTLWGKYDNFKTVKQLTSNSFLQGFDLVIFQAVSFNVF